jgi:hypothetical protein
MRLDRGICAWRLCTFEHLSQAAALLYRTIKILSAELKFRDSGRFAGRNILSRLTVLFVCSSWSRVT